MKNRSTNNDDAADLLTGAIDTHIHSGPDVVPRKFNDLELARAALKAGMKGIVIKCHIATTEGRAYLAHKEVPEVQVWGGIALNHNVGGFNPEAVRISAKMGAKIVWMPTVSSANHMTHFGSSGHMDALGGGMKGTGLTIYDSENKIRPGIIDILEIIKSENMILATGHLAPDESIELIKVALDQGIKKILFTHPEGHMTQLPLDEQKKLASKGVYFERCWVVTTNIAGEDARLSPEHLAQSIKAVGATSTVMATDHGQVVNHPPAEALKEYISAMLSNGISTKDIESMTQVNPSYLLC